MAKKDPLKSKRIFVGFNSAGAAGIYAFTRILKRRGYKIDFYGIGKAHFLMPTDFLLKFSSNQWLSFWQRIVVFLKILPRYDIWHFNYLETFFFYPLNLLILKLWGKKIVLTVRGSEAADGRELVAPNLYNQKSTAQWPQYYQNIYLKKNQWQTYLKRIRMKTFLYFADKVILTGPFLAGRVSRYDTIIPYARDIVKSKSLIKNRKKINKNIVVLHLPSEPIVKGTAEIEKIFTKLAKKYQNITFKILPKMPQEQLLKELSQADIVIDQIIIGWYGGQAVEAMAMGKIVMAYLFPPYLALVPYGKEIPIINTNPWTLERDIINLLENYAGIAGKLSLESSKFAFRHHQAAKIADQYLKVYQNCYE